MTGLQGYERPEAPLYPGVVAPRPLTVSQLSSRDFLDDELKAEAARTAAQFAKHYVYTALAMRGIPHDSPDVRELLHELESASHSARAIDYEKIDGLVKNALRLDFTQIALNEAARQAGTYTGTAATTTASQAASKLYENIVAMTVAAAAVHVAGERRVDRAHADAIRDARHYAPEQNDPVRVAALRDQKRAVELARREFAAAAKTGDVQATQAALVKWQGERATLLALKGGDSGYIDRNVKDERRRDVAASEIAEQERIKAEAKAAAAREKAERLAAERQAAQDRKAAKAEQDRLDAEAKKAAELAREEEVRAETARKIAAKIEQQRKDNEARRLKAEAANRKLVVATVTSVDENADLAAAQSRTLNGGVYVSTRQEVQTVIDQYNVAESLALNQAKAANRSTPNAEDYQAVYAQLNGASPQAHKFAVIHQELKKIETARAAGNLQQYNALGAKITDGQTLLSIASGVLFGKTEQEKRAAAELQARADQIKRDAAARGITFTTIEEAAQKLTDSLNAELKDKGIAGVQVVATNPLLAAPLVGVGAQLPTDVASQARGLGTTILGTSYMFNGFPPGVTSTDATWSFSNPTMISTTINGQSVFAPVSAFGSFNTLGGFGFNADGTPMGLAQSMVAMQQLRVKTLQDAVEGAGAAAVNLATAEAAYAQAQKTAEEARLIAEAARKDEDKLKQEAVEKSQAVKEARSNAEAAAKAAEKAKGAADVAAGAADKATQAVDGALKDVTAAETTLANLPAEDTPNLDPATKAKIAEAKQKVAQAKADLERKQAEAKAAEEAKAKAAEELAAKEAAKAKAAEELAAKEKIEKDRIEKEIKDKEAKAAETAATVDTKKADVDKAKDAKVAADAKVDDAKKVVGSGEVVPQAPVVPDVKDPAKGTGVGGPK